MVKVKVKICGITEKKDAKMCEMAGADIIGVVSNVGITSPRAVDLKKCGEILSQISSTKVVVACLNSIYMAEDIVKTVEPDLIQLHGRESVDLVKDIKDSLGIKVIKALQVKDVNVVKQAIEYSRVSDFILLDTYSKIGGGSGTVHDWGISRMVVENIKCPVILAGGLNPKNVKDAIKNVKPFAVDVSSGVEVSTGKKDLKLVLDFIKNAKSP